MAMPFSKMGSVRMGWMLMCKKEEGIQKLAEMLSGPCMRGRADMKLTAMHHMVTDIPFLHTHVACVTW